MLSPLDTLAHELAYGAARADLDGRGLLLRHPVNAGWVAIKDAPEQAWRKQA